MKAERIKGDHRAALTEQEGRVLYQFMAMKKAMGNLDVECSHDALGVIIAVQVGNVIRESKEGKAANE